MERLDKLLASTGRWSRREIKEMIRQGRVLVRGRPAQRPEEKYEPGEEFQVDGEAVSCQPYTYLMLNKPAGVLSATEDPRQETVLDLLPRSCRRQGLFPVGRLDRDTQGLLLLTNDGELAHRLLAPKSHVDKVYLAEVDGRVDGEDAAAFAAGLELPDLKCLPAGLEILGDGSRCRITLREGKFHQVKRMLAARGKPVLRLKRLSMGPLKLDESLDPGEWRPLTQVEMGALREVLGEK